MMPALEYRGAHLSKMLLVANSLDRLEGGEDTRRMDGEKWGGKIEKRKDIQSCFAFIKLKYQSSNIRLIEG